MVWGGHWHIFKPSGVDPADSTYAVEVFRRHDQYFGPFPLSYTTLADDDRLETLTIITKSTVKRKPFKMASSKETSKEDREFIRKLMKLDPRDRPSATMLLQDAWFGDERAKLRHGSGQIRMLC
jgi:serine/threonine protein kinase